MVHASSPPANGFVKVVRHIYNPLGFSKGYNFVLFFITIGYLLGFTLARLEYLSYYGIFCSPTASGGTGAAPGECYFYLRNPYKVGMMLHLFCILPAALLACLQFVPVIRHKLLLFHRLNGYIIITLSLVANAGVLIFLHVSFGGDFATQVWGGVLVISTTVSLALAYINIKLLRIDQHRAWMIRAWAYFATIITIRIIMLSSAAIMSTIGSWTTTRTCAQIAFTLREPRTLSLYPDCAAYFNGTDLSQRAIVHVNFYSNNPVEIGAALGVPFGAAGWLALWLHAIGVEIYLGLATKESSRLRQVSYERQVQRGWKPTAYSGVVVEGVKDAESFEPAGKLTVDNETLA